MWPCSDVYRLERGADGAQVLNQCLKPIGGGYVAGGKAEDLAAAIDEDGLGAQVAHQLGGIGPGGQFEHDAAAALAWVARGGQFEAEFVGGFDQGISEGPVLLQEGNWILLRVPFERGNAAVRCRNW